MIIAWCLKVFADPQWDKTLFLLVLDTGILLLQNLLYYVSLAHQDNPFESAILKKKIFHLLVGYIPPNFGPKRKTDSKAFKDEPLVIQNDSYSLAYAALIHPDVAANHKKSDAHMPSIKLLNEERESIFTGAMMITMFQIIYLTILTNYFMNGLEIKHSSDFLVMIPRVLSCIMMHMIVQPDMRQGLRLMKFAIKHPWFFIVIKETPEDPSEDLPNYDKADPSVVQVVDEPAAEEEDVDEDTGMLRRVICAFLLGFFQFAIACTAQILIILLLFKQPAVTDVMIKFVSFTGVTKFDDFYAANMTEHPIKKAAGKKLEFQFMRKQSEVHPDDYDKYKAMKKAH